MCAKIAAYVTMQKSLGCFFRYWYAQNAYFSKKFILTWSLDGNKRLKASWDPILIFSDRKGSVWFLLNSKYVSILNLKCHSSLHFRTATDSQTDYMLLIWHAKANKSHPYLSIFVHIDIQYLKTMRKPINKVIIIMTIVIMGFVLSQCHVTWRK